MTIKHAILFSFLQKNKLWKQIMEEKWATVLGENVWLVLHDFYSINIWFTSLTLSNGSKKYWSQQNISYCVIEEITLSLSKVK